MAVALAVDPFRIFAFWELREATARKGRPSLRVREVAGGGGKPGGSFEIRTGRPTGGLYVRVLPGRQYVVEAGVVTPAGRFMSAVSSRPVSTPPASPSDGKAELPESYFVFEPLAYRPGGGG